MTKPQPRTGQLVSRQTRRERGTPIPVETKRVTLQDGSAGTVSSLSLATAEVPERSYLAEACTVAYENHALALVFAQPKIGGKGLRSLLLITMTPSAATLFIRSVEEMDSPTLTDIARMTDIESEPLMKFPDEEPVQTATFIANIAAVAVSGREVTIDFYHANAFSYLHMRFERSLYLEPVVRVNLRTSQFLSLMDRMKELRAAFPSADRDPIEEKP